MAARNSSLERKQEEVIAALLTQRNMEEAARTAGVAVRTLIRWMKSLSSRRRIVTLAGPPFNNRSRGSSKEHRQLPPH